ncbi:MAG: patatin-like phospholipase family protein [candidate division WOR-3 bacterium]|nr:MAG: patatin-like phospholipase family protein [candidate division WOR-3 bacterium]
MLRASALALLAITFLAAQPDPALAPARVPVGRPVRIGLALSGGAALGFAHIGVLKVLERESIPVCCISGNSMGSLVGGIYAAGYSAAEMESIVVNADWDELFSSGVPFGARYLPERQQSQRYNFVLRHRNFVPSLPSGLVPLQNVEFLLMDLLSEIEYDTWFDFDLLPIPYRAVAVDLVTGLKLDLKGGRLSQAIRASIAIPGVFSPELLGEYRLVDGGVRQYLPVEPLLEFKPDFIIAVLTMKHKEESGIGLIDIASRSIDLVGVEDLGRQTGLADILIEPDVDPFAHSDFARAKGLITAGESAALAALPEIRRRLAGRRPVKVRQEVTVRSLAMVRSVDFSGLKVTRESTLRPLMQTLPWTYLQFKRLRQDLTRIFHTGLFEDVNYRLDFPHPDTVDVTVELVERAYGFYNLGIRYDNADDLGLGFEVGQGNLSGSGASIRAALHIGDPDEVRLGLTGTRIFTLPFGYRVDGFWGGIERDYRLRGIWQAGYTVFYGGGVAEAGYILGRNAFFDIAMTAYQASYRLPPLPVFDTLPRDDWIVGPRFRFEFNSFDDLFIPTDGLMYRAEAFLCEHRLGASHDFLKVDIESEQLFPVGRRLLARPGWEFGISSGDLAWSERFHVGGSNLPVFPAESFTAAHKLVGRFGIDFLVTRLFRSDDYPLWLQAFAAVGTFDRLDSVISDLVFAEDFDWGVGLGVLTNTPIGPLKVSVSLADFLKPGYETGFRLNWHMSVGRDFRYTR